MNPVIYQDPTTKTMYCTDGLRTVASPVARSYQWYFDDVLQPSLTSNSFTPTFSEAGLTVRCEVIIGASAVSSAPVVVTDWLRQALPGALVLLNAVNATPDSAGPYEIGGLYPISTWANEGSGPDLTQATADAKPKRSMGDLLGDWAGVPYVQFSTDDYIDAEITNSATEWTSYSVVRVPDSAATQTLWDTEAGRLLMRFHPARVRFFDGTNKAFDETEDGHKALTLRLGADARLWNARALDGTVHPYVPKSFGSTFRVGADATTPANFLNADVYFLAIYPEAHSDAQREQMWDYLESRFPVLF